MPTCKYNRHTSKYLPVILTGIYIQKYLKYTWHLQGMYLVLTRYLDGTYRVHMWCLQGTYLLLTVLVGKYLAQGLRCIMKWLLLGIHVVLRFKPAIYFGTYLVPSRCVPGTYRVFSLCCVKCFYSHTVWRVREYTGVILWNRNGTNLHDLQSKRRRSMVTLFQRFLK